MLIKNQTPHRLFYSLFNHIIYARRGNNNHILNFVRYYIINIYIWKCKVVMLGRNYSLKRKRKIYTRHYPHKKQWLLLNFFFF